MEFSSALVADTIRVFQEEHGVLLSHDEAIRILNSLAGLYLAFSEKSEITTPAAAFSGAGVVMRLDINHT